MHRLLLSLRERIITPENNNIYLAEQPPEAVYKKTSIQAHIKPKQYEYMSITINHNITLTSSRQQLENLG